MQSYSGTRDFNQLPYYKFNKILLSAIGLWSIRNTKCGLIRRGFVTANILFTSFILISKLVTTPITMELIASVVPMLLSVCTCTAKFFIYIYYRKEMAILLNHMKNDWQKFKLSDDIRIMKKYVENINRYTIIYILYTYMSIFGYCFISFSSPILDIIAPLNKSRPRKLLVEAEYFVDPEKYFYPIICHMCFTGTLGLSIVLALDIVFVTYIQHACALFAIASNHLECILYDEKSLVHEDENYFNIHNFFRRRIAYCAKIHRKAIKFAGLIEASFTWWYLMQCLISMTLISITLMQFTMSLNEANSKSQSTILAGGQMFHVYLFCLAGQKLIDHSNNIATAAYHGKWYDMPIKSQKLLLLVIRRGMEPCFLTAGHMCVISLTTFSKIMQTSMSYFTVLYSL